MAHLGSSVEYGLHCLLWLVEPVTGPTTSGDLAELQGVSPSFIAKIFTRLEKAGIVEASEGARGGYRLGRPASDITVLDVVDATEGKKPLFDCKEIRGLCTLYGDKRPASVTGGICAIHAVMLRAEQSMRDELARTTLATLAATVESKMPADFPATVQNWFSGRMSLRADARGNSTGPPRAKPTRGHS